MIDLGPHAFFILTAYLGVGVVTLALIARVAFDARQQKSRLAALEADGIRTRSASHKRKPA